MQRPPEPAEVSAALERALARPELGRGENPLYQATQDVIDWLSELFDWDFAPELSRGALQATAWVLVALLAALLVVLALRLARGRTGRRSERRAASHAARVAVRVEELRARARDAEAAGDWLGALRLHFFALVVGLGQRGDLEYRAAWTNRELLARGEPTPAVAAALRPLVVELDARSFGTLEAGPDDVRRFAAACDRMMEAAP